MKNKRRNDFTRAKWGIIAVCVAMLVLCIPMVISLSSVEDDNTPTIESLSIENNKVEDLQNEKEESANIQERQLMSEELQDRIDELNLSDCLGWIVYDARIYIQDLDIDSGIGLGSENNIELSDCLGRASDYTGAYRSSVACDGDVYMVVSNPDILCLKLDNGATIWLVGED